MTLSAGIQHALVLNTNGGNTDHIISTAVHYKVRKAVAQSMQSLEMGKNNGNMSKNG